MAIIAISRGSHSGGRALAECVAERLGCECISREEALSAAAELYGVSADSLRAEERAPSVWERLGGQSSQYLCYVRAALFQHARGGNLVYHGYMGHLVLAGAPRVLRVRLNADLEYRVAAVMQQQQQLARREAIAYIEKVDKERRDWVRFLFGVDWDDPSLYHLVLNASLMSVATACDVVAHLAEQDEFKSTAASVKTMEDLALSSAVLAVLARDQRTAGADLRVAADAGMVSITGTARSREIADAIREVVAPVAGVAEIREDVRVARPYYR